MTTLLGSFQASASAGAVDPTNAKPQLPRFGSIVRSFGQRGRRADCLGNDHILFRKRKRMPTVSVFEGRPQPRHYRKRIRADTPIDACLDRVNVSRRLERWQCQKV
jgi:hypothetical protein